MKTKALAFLTLVALALGPVTALALEKIKRVAIDTDWAAFEASEPRECWAATAPKQTENSRDGSEISFQRGDILLNVSWRPEQNVAGEVSFSGGYAFAEGSTAILNIGGKTFELFTEEEFAWPASPVQDQEIVTALKRGASAVITGRSSLGIVTRDTFSLFGATAMIEDAGRRCAK